MTYAKLSIYNTTTSSYNDYTVNCTAVAIGWTNNNVAKPNANGGSVVEVQKQSFENPIYTLQGVHLDQVSSTTVLTYSKLLEMAKLSNTGTNPLLLKVNYGIDLIGSDTTTTSIPVVIKSYQMPLDVKKKSTSGNFIAVGSIILQETA